MALYNKFFDIHEITCWDFDWDCVDSIDQVEKNWHLGITESFSPGTWNVHLARLWFFTRLFDCVGSSLLHRLFSDCGEHGCPLVMVCGLLVAVAFLTAAAATLGSRAQVRWCGHSVAPTSALLTLLTPVSVRIATDCGEFLKRWEHRATWPASWELCMQLRKQQWELDMEKQTGSKLGKEYLKAVYCHPAYLTYSRVHHEKRWTGWSTS